MTVAMEQYKGQLRALKAESVLKEYGIQYNQVAYVNRKPGDYPDFILDRIEKEITEDMFLDFTNNKIEIDNKVALRNPSKNWGGDFLIGVVKKLTLDKGVTVSLIHNKRGETSGTRNVPPNCVVVVK